MLLLPSSILVQNVAVGLLAASIHMASLDVSPSSPPMLPVLEVIKVYGKLAGPECYGQKAPKGSSCQVTFPEVQQMLGLDDTKSVLTKDEFRDRLDRAEFQWPLKPFGIDKSLTKTATMNKGAETKVFMDQLEERGLYDKRNPTGPLPTSLRPQLNKALQKEGIDPMVADRTFRVLGGENDQLKVDNIKQVLGNEMDYYGFLELIGKESITWPY